MSTLQNIALLDPSLIGDEGEDSNDPRRRLLKTMSLQAMASLMGNRSDTENPDDRGGGQDDVDADVDSQSPISGQGGGMSAGRVGPVADDSNPTGNARGNIDHGNSVGRLVRSGDRDGVDSLSQMSGDDATEMGMLPPGFDENGMPSEYPATGPKNAAAGRLERANENLYPSTTKGKLIRGALTMAPALLGLIGGGGAAGAGAAEGAAEGADEQYKRRLGERTLANEQYQFEAGREEREREQAIRERVAMANIQANRAYRTLMASISSRKADISQENADRNAANSGFVVQKGADGVNHMVPLNPDQLSAMKQAQLGLNQAQEDLAKARTLAIPEQIKIAEDRLKIQQGMLQRSLAALELQQEGLNLRLRSEDYKETGPTMSSKNMGQMAATVPEHIADTRALIHQAAQKGYIGPLAGRVFVDFLAGRVGTTGDDEADYLLGSLKTNSKLLTSAMLRTHFNGRGISLYGSFEDMIAAKQSEAMLMGDLDGFDKYIQQYSKMGQWSGAQQWQSLRPQPGNAAQKLKRGQGSSTGNKSNVPSSVPQGARIRHFSELGAN
jgi:hypothetical protein